MRSRVMFRLRLRSSRHEAVVTASPTPFVSRAPPSTVQGSRSKGIASSLAIRELAMSSFDHGGYFWPQALKRKSIIRRRPSDHTVIGPKSRIHESSVVTSRSRTDSDWPYRLRGCSPASPGGMTSTTGSYFDAASTSVSNAPGTRSKIPGQLVSRTGQAISVAACRSHSAGQRVVDFASCERGMSVLRIVPLHGSTPRLADPVSRGTV